MKFEQFAELSRAVRAWAGCNFPANTIQEPFAGTIEELGEWVHALLKRRQAIRHTPEELDALEQDAIADLVIYLSDWYARRSDDRTGGTEYAAAREVLRRISDLSIAPYGIEDDDVKRILRVLERYCETHGWDLAAIVEKTWADVSQRDWNAHRAHDARAIEADSLARVEDCSGKSRPRRQFVLDAIAAGYSLDHYDGHWWLTRIDEDGVRHGLRFLRNGCAYDSEADLATSQGTRSYYKMREHLRIRPRETCSLSDEQKATLERLAVGVGDVAMAAGAALCSVEYLEGHLD